jgi:diacylglycerol O-acyltransferase
MAQDVAFDTRMSDQEALMWALEQDPVLRSSFANVTLLDRPADHARLRERLVRAAELVPRLRQRVAEAGGLTAPNWVEDPLFDIDFHLRRLALPSPGGLRELLDLAAVISADPFDRARPLWQFVLVEGLDGGRGAMIQKLHHTITDGEGGVRLSTKFLDLERDADTPLDDGEEPPPEPGARSALSAVTDGMRRPMGLARRVASEAVETMTNPFGVPGRAGDAVGTARSLLRQVAVIEPARSPLWTERSLRRHLEVLSIPLGDAKRAAAALGGTVNDLFVTGAAGAAGAYHRARGVDVDLLRMAMPVSTRQSGEGGGNAFAPTRLLVPVGLTDPAERFRAVQDVLASTKAERALGAAAGMAGVLASLPTPLLVRAARQQVGTVDFTTSNVRGAPFDLYFAGARIEGNHPIGPLAGTAFNLTTLSYAGNLDMGLLVDTAAIDEPGLLHDLLVVAYEELLVAGA